MNVRPNIHEGRVRPKPKRRPQSVEYPTYRVTIYALTVPPSPFLYRDFEWEIEADGWARWAKNAMPCEVRKKVM